MAVIINELEVVVEAPRDSAAAAPPPMQPAPALVPRDLADILERQAQHRIRVEAH